MFLPAAADSLILNSNDPIHSIYFGRLFFGGDTFVFMTQHIAQGDLHIFDFVQDDEWSALSFPPYAENLLPL